MLRLVALAAALAPLSAVPAAAQEVTAPPPPVTLSGNVTVVSDYRFRGVSQSDREFALQGGITVAHQSGFYAGLWSSNVSGWGTFGGGNLELDVIAGYRTPLGSAGTVDVGVTWYTFPGGSDRTDFFEPYARLSGTLGPAALTASVAYAPKQTALGNFSATPFSRGQREDNLYLAGDASVGIPTTPITARAHIGRSDGNPGLGPNGTSLAPTGVYWDWSLGADVVYRNLTFNLSYVDTDITRANSAYLLPNFQRTGGGSIANPTVVASVSLTF